MRRCDRQFIEVALAVDHTRHCKPNDRAEVVDRHPGAPLGRRPRQALGPVRRIVRAARDARIVDVPEPLAGHDVNRLHRRHITGRRIAHHDRQLHVSIDPMRTDWPDWRVLATAPECS